MTLKCNARLAGERSVVLARQRLELVAQLARYAGVNYGLGGALGRGGHALSIGVFRGVALSKRTSATNACQTRLVFVRVEADGSAAGVTPAFTKLGNLVNARGYEVFVEDPASLAAGSGRFEGKLPDDFGEDGARRAVQSLIAEAGGEGFLSIIERDSD